MSCAAPNSIPICQIWPTLSCLHLRIRGTEMLCGGSAVQSRLEVPVRALSDILYELLVELADPDMRILQRSRIRGFSLDDDIEKVLKQRLTDHQLLAVSRMPAMHRNAEKICRWRRFRPFIREWCTGENMRMQFKRRMTAVTALVTSSRPAGPSQDEKQEEFGEIRRGVPSE